MIARTWSFFLVGVMLLGPSVGKSETSVSQYGITWQFDQDRPVGQYANGDWWVLGPVSIVSIFPLSETAGGRVINGTQLNLPLGTSQGFDSFDSDMSYRSELNVAPSMTGSDLYVITGSVVSSVSLADPPSNGRPVLSDLAVLTVVSEVPTAGSFRPDPYGTDKTSRYYSSDLDLTILRDLPSVSGAPSLDSAIESVGRFWNEQNPAWSGRVVHAQDNQPNYGREIANEMAESLLMLHIGSHTRQQRTPLLINLVQRGLDIYGAAVEGAVWPDDGGHGGGRKMPLLLAGLALDASEILAIGDASSNLIFGEDRQTFYVTAADIGRSVDSGHETYSQQHVGLAEWGIKHTSQPSMDDSSWGASYRWIGASYLGHALMAHLTPGAVQAWNHSAFFDYMDRFEELGSPGSGLNDIQAFQQAMWNAYRNDASTPRPKAPILDAN